MRELTKETLEEQGITIVVDPNEECGYKITRYGRYFKSYNMTLKQIKPTINGKVHPYGETQYYWIVGWSYKGQAQVYPLARVIYAYFNGKAPGDMDVDHINEDSLDNRVENLQLLSRRDNLAKRKGKRNQFC